MNLQESCPILRLDELHEGAGGDEEGVLAPDEAQSLDERVPTIGDVLRRWGDAVGEVANEPGLTANNATVRLHRARRALRQRIETVCGTCTEHACLDCTCGKPL